MQASKKAEARGDVRDLGLAGASCQSLGLGRVKRGFVSGSVVSFLSHPARVLCGEGP